MGIGALYVGAVGACGTLPTTLHVGYQPEQPVPFSHRLHAGVLKMDCPYCHYTVERAAEAAIPPTAVCTNCHSAADADGAAATASIHPKSLKLPPVRQSRATGRPIPRWRRWRSASSPKEAAAHRPSGAVPDSSGAPGGLAHVTSWRTLAAVFGALILLTVLTVVAASLPAGAWEAWISLGIATLKASLAAAYFMHLRYDKGFHSLLSFISALLFVGLFLGMTRADTEQYQGAIESFTENAGLP